MKSFSWDALYNSVEALEPVDKLGKRLEISCICLLSWILLQISVVLISCLVLLQDLYEDQGFQQALKTSYGNRPVPVSICFLFSILLHHYLTIYIVNITC